MAGLTITTGTKEHLDAFKKKEKCTTTVAIETLLNRTTLLDAVQRENKLLRAEIYRMNKEYNIKKEE